MSATWLGVLVLMCPMTICKTQVVLTYLMATSNGIEKHVTVWQMLKPPLSCFRSYYAKLCQMEWPLWQMLCHLNVGDCLLIL